MGMTTAQRVQAYRVRQRERITELTAELARAQETIARQQDRITELEAAQCRHPAQVVQGGTCLACGADVW